MKHLAHPQAGKRLLRQNVGRATPFSAELDLRENCFCWRLAGRARARLITHVGASNLGRLTAGDAFGVPAGFVFGAHNDGNDKFRLLGVTNLAGARREEGKNVTVSFLRRALREFRT